MAAATLAEVLTAMVTLATSMNERADNLHAALTAQYPNYADGNCEAARIVNNMVNDTEDAVIAWTALRDQA